MADSRSRQQLATIAFRLAAPTRFQPDTEFQYFPDFMTWHDEARNLRRRRRLRRGHNPPSSLLSEPEQAVAFEPDPKTSPDWPPRWHRCRFR